MYDSQITPGRMVPPRGDMTTSRPKNPHEMLVAKHDSYARTISVFVFGHNEELHASSLSDFHSQKILIPITNEPENLIVTLFRDFLLW